MNMQKRYWSDMVNCKYHLNYISNCIDDSYKRDNGISVFNAVASSFSIAGWAIWNDIPYVWSFIIAASQVLTAIKPYLPYSKRIKNLNSYASEASSIFLDYEYNWLKVASGNMTNDNINDKIIELKIKLDKLGCKYINTITLPENEKLESKAEIDTDNYFEAFA